MSSKNVGLDIRLLGQFSVEGMLLHQSMCREAHLSFSFRQEVILF